MVVAAAIVAFPLTTDVVAPAAPVSVTVHTAPDGRLLIVFDRLLGESRVKDWEYTAVGAALLLTQFTDRLNVRGVPHVAAPVPVTAFVMVSEPTV